MELKIGNYQVLIGDDGTLWINNLSTGEGGTFNQESFEKVIADFFMENF